MPISSVIDGEVVDWHFKQGKELNFVYTFYIGDTYIGDIYKMTRGSWDAVSAFPNNICPVKGFSTRLDAAEFLEKLWKNHNAANKPF